MRDADVKSLGLPFKQEIRIAPHLLVADEPVDKGGGDEGPEPHEFLLAALGTCTSMTLNLYARRKGWPLTSVQVHVSLTVGPEGAKFARRIELDGALDDEQRARLLDIANKCPVHKTLTGNIQIESTLTPTTKT
jgi:putative redox protein